MGLPPSVQVMVRPGAEVGAALAIPLADTGALLPAATHALEAHPGMHVEIDSAGLVLTTTAPAGDDARLLAVGDAPAAAGEAASPPTPAEPPAVVPLPRAALWRALYGARAPRLAAATPLTGDAAAEWGNHALFVDGPVPRARLPAAPPPVTVVPEAPLVPTPRTAQSPPADTGRLLLGHPLAATAAMAGVGGSALATAVQRALAPLGDVQAGVDVQRRAALLWISVPQGDKTRDAVVEGVRAALRALREPQAPRVLDALLGAATTQVHKRRAPAGALSREAALRVLWLQTADEPKPPDRLGLSMLLRASLFPEALRVVDEPAPGA